MMATASGATGLESLETEDLRLLYRAPIQSYLAPHAARCFENSMAFQRRVLGWSPSAPVTVLLNDYSDVGNASALGVPRNLLLLETSPIGIAYESVSTNERLNWLFNHELVHIATVDRAARRDRAFRRLFLGKVAPTSEQPETILWFYLTAPRDAAPRWYHEGFAVFAETWMAGGVGRAQGAWDEMVFRSMVRDGARFHDPLSLVAEGTKTDFQVEVNSYLYGTRFMTWLANERSPEALVRWVVRDEGSKAYFGARFREVFGVPLKRAWQDWTEAERVFQEENLARIRKHPITPWRDLTTRAFGSVSKAALDEEKEVLYTAFHYPGTVSHLGAVSLRDGSVRKILDVKDPLLLTVTSLAWDGESRRLFYTTDNREYRDLREVHPDTGKSRTLLKDARIGDLAIDPVTKTLWGVRHFNGIASIVGIPPPYDAWQLVRSWPYGEVPRDLDVSPDGALLAVAVGGIDGRHDLRVYRIEDLLAGEGEPVAVTDFGDAAPLHFVFAPDGRRLYGTTTYTGVPNVFVWDPEGGAVDAVTNAETGFFRPLPRPDGSLIVFRYTGDGFVPAEIRPEPIEDVEAIEFLGARLIENHPVLTEWNVGSPARVPLDDLVREKGPYRSGREIRIESLYPVLEGYKDSVAAGMRLNLSDPLMLNRLNLTVSYSPDDDLDSDERLHADFRYQRYDWRARATWNDADFYDLFGPTKRGRRGYSVGAGWGRTLVYDLPRTLRFDADAAYYGDLEQLPDYQNVAAPTSSVATATARLAYSNVRSSLGHVDDEKGRRASVAATLDHASGETFPKLLATFDQGLALPLSHSSVWFRTAAGSGSGDRANPFSSFFLGGFGNNWVDRGNEKRYREAWSLPGAELNSVGGRTFGKLLVEWNLPPLRFRRAGSPGFHATWARASIFAGGVATDFDESALSREVGTAGAQVDVRFTVLSRLDMTVSVGWATAFERGLPPRDEFMASLKVLP